MQKLVNIDDALMKLGVDMPEYMERVQDLKEYVNEVYPELQAYIDHDNYSAVQEICDTLKDALTELQFVAAQDVAVRLEKSGSTQAEDPVALLRELQQVITKSLKLVEAF
jgi:hypothetical protein